MRASGKRRLRIAILLVVLALGGVGVGGFYFVSSQLQPRPARYAAGVVAQGTALDEVLSMPVARAYLRDFRTQETWSSCGPASVRNVLASFGVAVADENALFGDQTWQRWRMRVMGMNLDALAALVNARGLGQASVLRDLPYDAFVQSLGRANDPTDRYIVNFDRAPIFGVAVPHFSPIAGYDGGSDRVALLDVTPGYGPALIPSRLLYRAVRTQDPETGRSRGLLLVRRPKERPQGGAPGGTIDPRSVETHGRDPGGP